MLNCFRSPGKSYSLVRHHEITYIYQGLPVCVALSLTIVAKRMAKHHVLVKNLATIETLGCMSVLCSDKTGTLTMGQMVTHF
jgi:sodium/potassium-transporting ATPase subunit alpha